METSTNTATGTEWSVDELTAMMKTENRKLEKQLVHAGGSLEPWLVVNTRLDLLINTVMPDPSMRDQFELAWQKALFDLLTVRVSAQHRANLLAPK